MSLLNTLFIHPRVFINLGGKREWDPSTLGLN
jgi:uncharacterized Zn-finger protein